MQRAVFNEVCFKVLFIVWAIESSTTYVTAQLCEGTCCPGYKWNAMTKSCEQCMLGYFGSNCTHPCHYPTYGDKCREICACNKDSCDFSTGCRPTIREYMVGYFGRNCTNQCPYPSYGENCQGYYDYEKDSCDVSTGCRFITNKCMAGYFGPNCTYQCRYPSYGDSCQDNCDCDVDRCDVSTGCRPISTGAALSAARLYWMCVGCLIFVKGVIIQI